MKMEQCLVNLSFIIGVMNEPLDTAKLIIYAMTASIMKINPQYFSIEALAAIGRNEVQLLKNLSEVLDEDLTLNELIINVFDKERFH